MRGLQERSMQIPGSGERQAETLDAAGRAPVTLVGKAAAVAGEATRRLPASAELVEHYDTGKLYLRAYMQGRYVWQEVETDDLSAIPDRGVWAVDGSLLDTYWLNHGTFRRRAGKFRAVAQHAPAA
jgi:hypothetical protein